MNYRNNKITGGLTEEQSKEMAAAVERAKSIDAMSYRLPSSHESWSETSTMLKAASNGRFLYMGIDSWTPEPDAATREGFRDLAIAGSKLAAFDFPFFLVGEALLEELQHTDALADLSILTDAPLPFDAFMLLPPLGALTRHCPFSRETEVPVRSLIVTVDDGDILVIFTMSPTVEGYRAVTNESPREGGSLFTSLRLPLTDRGVMVTDPAAILALGAPYINEDQGQKDAEESARMAQLISNVLAVMASEPELVEDRRVLSTIRKHGGKVTKRFMSPRWVGRSVKRSYAPESGESGGSVKPHWRRGYVRRQRHGPGRQLTKIVRIRPVRVNSQKEVEA